MKKQNDIEVISTVPIKFKNKKDRNWKAFNLMSQFGFLPESIIISKVPEQNNTIILSAVLPKKSKT